MPALTEPLDIDELRSLRESLRDTPARARATLRGYAHDWRVFTKWCAMAGVCALPATSETIALYVTWMLVQMGRKVTTAARHVAGIVYYHRQAGHALPALVEVKNILDVVRRRRRERPCGKAALNPDELLSVASACDTSTNAGSRDRAIVVLGFATSLRRSELARLSLDDLRFADEGLIVTVGRSKTDQSGRGRIVGVWRGKRSITDPVEVLHHWIERRGDWRGPLFPRIKANRISNRPISGQAINGVVKRSIQRAGMNPASYGAHSLRAGAITAAAAGGRSDQEIMQMSGHANAHVMRSYIRITRVFAGRNPLEGVL